MSNVLQKWYLTVHGSYAALDTLLQKQVVLVNEILVIMDNSAVFTITIFHNNK